MKNVDSIEYLGYSHATYLENDPIQYKVTCEQITITENQTYHFHDDIELLFILNGEAAIYINGEHSLISEGSLIVLMPHHVHSIKLNSDSLTVHQCKVSLGLLMYSSISRVIEKHISYSLAYGNVITTFTGNEKKAIKECFIEIIDEIHHDKLFSTMAALNLVCRILLLFGRKVISNISDTTNPDHSLTWRLMQYINDNFSNEISARKIAEEFSLTPLKVNNYFYLLTGENLADNLHRVRIRYACSMLQFEQLSCSFIGKYVGYKNTSSFFRKFKEIKNITPDEYRKSHVPSDNIFQCLNISWKIVLYLYENYFEPLNEDAISKALFLSPDTIRSELIANFNTSLPDLLTRIRIQYACSYLQVLDDPILKISYLCGFSSVRTFNRCFLELRGCTPNEYRKRMRQKMGLI
jgi:AraC-like DNA-binding protein